MWGWSFLKKSDFPIFGGALIELINFKGRIKLHSNLLMLMHIKNAQFFKSKILLGKIRNLLFSKILTKLLVIWLSIGNKSWLIHF